MTALTEKTKNLADSGCALLLMKEFMKNLWLTITIILAASAGLLAGATQRAWSETPAAKKTPVTVTADHLDYDRATDVYIAEGHVKIEHEDIRLEADKVVLDNKTGVVEAEGNVYLQDQGNVVRAAKLTTNIRTAQGVIYKGSVFLKKDNYYLAGDVIERKSETVYQVERGEFTTCDEGDWFVKAKELNIDLNRYATGKDVTLTMGHVPILYTPYFLFPVRRQTGFLVPEPGYSRSEGFTITNTFFWAISDSQDMTLASDYRGKVGNGISIDYRYNISQDSMGDAYVKYWDIFHTEVSRWNFDMKHKEEFSEDLSGRLDINLVSDFNYYHDLEHDLAVRALPYVDSNAFGVQRGETSSLYLLGQYSTNLTQSNAGTIQTLPQLRYTIYEASLAGPVHFNFDGTATNFDKQGVESARRLNFNPELTATFGSGGLSMTPRAGAYAAFYDRSATTDESTQLNYAYAELAVNSRISKIYGSDGDVGVGRVRHSIEPTILYTYIPHVDQQNIPQFDSQDTVLEQNRVTYSIINRLTAHYKESKDSPQYSSFDMMVFKLSQSYNVNVASNPTGTVQPLSEILAELYVKTPKAFTMSASTTYNTYSRMVTSRSVSASYTNSVVSLNLAENYVQSSAAHFIIGGGTLNLGKWTLNAEVWRDIENRQTTEQDYSVNYQTQCWGIKALIQERPGDYRYTVLVDLKGLGSKDKPK